MAHKKKNRILDLDPANLREIDGVVFDLDSFARHCAPHPYPSASAPAAPLTETPDAAPEAAPSGQPEPPSGAPAAVFLCDPVHIGWYPVETQVAYPIMAGAMEPGAAAQQTVCCGSGSFLSSYLTSLSTSYRTSYLTSFLTSYRISYLLSSGSSLGSLSGSYRSAAGSGLCVATGGYGLELI